MTATTASDPNGVEYYFDETTGNSGGTDSGWQDSPSYVDTGLSPGTPYTYRVKTRDKSANQNTGTYSSSQNTTTNLPPSLVSLILMPGSSQASEPNTNAAFRVDRNGNTSQALTVYYQASGAAINGTDYTNTENQLLSGQVTFLVGQQSATIPIKVVDDSLAEDTETVIITLLPDPSYLVDSAASTREVYIFDNDKLPGDYDLSGVVDLIDFNTWRATYDMAVVPRSRADGNGNGTVDAGDYVIWRNSFVPPIPAIVGDYDLNGIVQQHDYEIWRSTFNTHVSVAGSGADGNHDGFVDGADYIVWRNNLPPSIVHLDGNAMWNDKVYISWQNVTHINNPDSTNMVIDTWKVDDNGDGDPRNDENRIFATEGQNVGANGIMASLSDGGGVVSGTVAAATQNADGSATLTLSDVGGSGAIQVKYTVRPNDGDIYGELIVTPVQATDLHWGVTQINAAANLPAPGAVALYNQAAVNGTIITARAVPTDIPSQAGFDYLLYTTSSTSYVTLMSTSKQWTTGMILTSTPIPVDMHAWLGMIEQSNFPRFASINMPFGTQLPTGNTYHFGAVFHADKDLTLHGYPVVSPAASSAADILSSNSAVQLATSAATTTQTTPLSLDHLDSKFAALADRTMLDEPSATPLKRRSGTVHRSSFMADSQFDSMLLLLAVDRAEHLVTRDVIDVLHQASDETNCRKTTSDDETAGHFTMNRVHFDSPSAAVKSNRPAKHFA